MTTTSDTPTLEPCPFCGSELYVFPCQNDETTYWRCGTDHSDERGYDRSWSCYEKERSEFKVIKAEVKEIRAALGDDGRRTHKEILEMAFKASGWREWKKKYIDLNNAHIAEGQDPAGTIWEHADRIQQELKESKAEVERLKTELADWDYGTRAKREQARAERAEAELTEARQWLDERYKALSEADERAEKAESEVERLKSDKAHLITQCANLLESLVPSDKSPSAEWHRKQALNKKAYLK